jgi:hypothetical protein
MVEHHKPLYIYHHLGLGDHIICNAIVRNIRKKLTNKLFLFCKPYYFNSVSFMYRDIDLTIVPFDDKDVINFFNEISPKQQIIIGHQFLNISGGISFDEAFYKQIGLNFNKRWSDFYVERDNNRERDLVNKLRPADTYAFVHEDPTRNFIIDRTHIASNLNIVTPQDGLTDNIFDYLNIIQHATEIHCIDSCFKLMIDSAFNRSDLKGKLIFHYNLKNKNIKDKTVSKHKLDWLVI